MSVELRVRVTPKASSNRIVKQEDGSLKIYVTCVPEDGKANEAVIALLAEELGVSKSSLSIVRGLTSRDKTIRVA